MKSPRASWAPGLKLAIATAVNQHLQPLIQEPPQHGWDVFQPQKDGQPASLQPPKQGREHQQPFSVQQLTSSTDLNKRGQPSSLPSHEQGPDMEHFSVQPPQTEEDATAHFSVQSPAGRAETSTPSSMRFPREKMNEASKHPHQRHHEPQLHALGAAALEQWRRHYLNDHLPARRDCAQCVRAQARSKPHRRIEHPESFTLSVDLSGKLSPGDDQHGKDCKYLLVGCYTYPVTKDGKSLVPIPGQSDQEEDHPLPGLDEDLDADVDEHPHEDDEAVLPEEEELVDEGDSPEVRAARSMQDTWLRLVKESKNVMVKHLTFVEPVKSRNVKHVLPAISRLHARIRSLGLPVYRLHSDRAREFCAAPIKAWALERSILTTMTSGSTYKANGRVEGEMNVVKKAIRTLITAGTATLKQWPLAARHIGERRLRVQLNQLGWPVGRLLRFGATAFALRKSWQERYDAIRSLA